jgi:hypothetical protein
MDDQAGPTRRFHINLGRWVLQSVAILTSCSTPSRAGPRNSVQSVGVVVGVQDIEPGVDGRVASRAANSALNRSSDEGAQRQ